MKSFRLYCINRLKHVSKTFVTDPQFWISLVVGWIVFSMLSPNIHNRSSDIQKSKKANEMDCLPCVDNICNPCKSESLKFRGDVSDQKQFYREFSWTPQKAIEEENNYWKLSSLKYRDGMKNDDPRIGINGMWRLERERMNKYLQDNHNKEHSKKRLKFKSMIRKLDPFYGVSYIVNVDSTQSDQALSQNDDKKSKIYEIRRKFKSGRPVLLEIKPIDENEIVNIITPLSKVTERFHKFLSRLEENIYSDHRFVQVKLIFVIFGNQQSTDGSQTVSALQRFQLRNPNALMQHTFVRGDFNRAIGLDTGVKLCSDDALMLFLDVDLSITPAFLDRIRLNTIEHKSVVFPVMFSQFDPEVVNTFTKSVWVPESREEESPIGGNKGFWIYYAFGVASMYKSDYNKVGGFPLDIVGWGGEDVQLFKKFINDPVLDVMSTVDPDLIHIYHSRSCDVTLAPDQYRMCIGSMSETIGSEIQIGTLYLKNKEREYFDTQKG